MNKEEDLNAKTIKIKSMIVKDYRKKECKYCKENMESEWIEKDYIMLDNKFLYFWCDCGRKCLAEINYCPMCGRELNDNKNI